MKISVGIEKSKLSDVYSLWMEKDGQKRYIHSKYSPIIEAKRFSDEIKKNQKITYIVFGGGLLYHIWELINNGSNIESVVVVEPNKEVFELARKQEIYEKILENKNITILCYENTENFEEMFNDVLEYLKVSNIAVSCFKYYDYYYEDMYKLFIKTINTYTSFREIDENTSERFIIEHMQNILSNIFSMRDCTFASNFKDKFKGKTAIVVSAGPSLDKNIDLLKGNEDKFLILSGGRTLKTLLGRGIKPHFTITLDPSYRNFQLIEDVLDNDVPMLNSMLTNKEIPIRYKGPKIFLDNSGINNIDTFFFDKKLTTISVSGTVASMQLNFAQYLGCNKIVFIGQDLAYTDNKAHADSTAILKDEQGAGNDLSAIKDDFIAVKGNVKDKVYTDELFMSYKMGLEQYIKEFEDIDVYNCTEGGAYIEGTKVMSLKDFIDNNSSKSYDFYTEIKDIIEKHHETHDENYIKKRMNELENLSNTMINITKEGLKIVQKNIKNGFETQKDIDRLAKIDKKIKKISEKLDFSYVLARDIMLMFERAYIDETKSEKEKYQDIRKISRSYYAAVQGIYKSIDFFVKQAVSDFEKRNAKEDEK